MESGETALLFEGICFVFSNYWYIMVNYRLMIGDKYDMSLVQFVLTEEFVLVGGDTRGTDINGNLISEKFNKVIKLNKNIIIGCSGSAQDSHFFLENYCDFSREYGLTCKESPCNLTFTELISELNNRYNEILQIHTNNTDNRVFNFTVIVCGHNGNKFVAMQYSFTTDYINMPMGVHLIETNPDTGIRCFMIGTDKYLLRHNTNYNDELRKNQPSTILQYKNIMQNVFDMGVKFDGTINNINIYEKIRKKDIL